MNTAQDRIVRRRQNIDLLAEIVREMRDKMQGNCLHPDVDKKYCGSTGNYDPSADGYWIDWSCPDCGKFWRTDQ